jgi:hypothetical protein
MQDAGYGLIWTSENTPSTRSSDEGAGQHEQGYGELQQAEEGLIQHVPSRSVREEYPA